MRPAIALAVLLGCAAIVVSAQSPSSSYARGSSLQSWQDPGHKGVVAKCKTPVQPFSLSGTQPANAKPSAPPEPLLRPRQRRSPV
jgi:hypothetical protein